MAGGAEMLRLRREKADAQITIVDLEVVKLSTRFGRASRSNDKNTD